MEKEYIKGKVIWDDVNNCGMIKGTKLDTNLFPTIKKENINEYVDILYETYKPYKTEYINGIKDKNGKDIQKINPINNGNHTNRNRQHTNQTQTQNNNGARDNRPQNNGNRRNEKPTAPYNFIPLNEKIVPSPWNDESQIPHLLQHRANLLSGYLDITLENLSDFFIGNTTHFEDDKQKKQCHGIKDKYGNPIIMGSSIRGMIKNLMEIMAYSKISNVNNDTLYYKQNRKKQIYLKSTLDHIKYENEVALDMTQALFGEMGKFSTRLNFGSAHFLQYNGGEKEEKEKPQWYPSFYTLQSAASPKPTYYKFYLEPEGTTTKDWNGGTLISGHKLYHHKNTNDAYKSNEGRKDSDASLIKPLRPNHVFQQRIHFTNLCKEELGLLLLALKLGADSETQQLRHKLGFGKQHGLGSMKIEIKDLILINRQSRYQTLFDDNGNLNTGEQNKTSCVDTFISYFTTYLLENLKEKEGTSISDFWQLERMKQLAAMLNYKNIDFGNWNNITKYLTPQQHGSNKKPLPLPTKLFTTT